MNEESELLEGLIKTQAAKDLEGLLPKLDHRMRGLLTPKQSFRYKTREHVFRARTLKRALAFSVIALLFFSLGLHVNQNPFFNLGLELSPKFESQALPRVLAANYEQLEVVATGSDDPLAMALQAAGLVYLTIIDPDESIDSDLLEQAKSVDDSEKLVLIETGPNALPLAAQAQVCKYVGPSDPIELNTVGILDDVKKIKVNKEIFRCYKSGDERRPLTKRLRGPAALVVNTAGEIFVADRISESQTVVYKITPTSYWLNRLLRSKDK